MKFKRFVFLIIFIYISSSIAAQELILLKTFNINGREETKKVKIIAKSENTYSGKLKIFSENGKIKALYFYDENDLLVRYLRPTWETDYDLLSFEYDWEKNIAEMKLSDSYEETLYFYDKQNHLIKETTSSAVAGVDDVIATTYTYDENGRVVQKEDNYGLYKYDYNDKNQIIHESFSGGSLWDYYYEYDDLGRQIYSKNVYNEKDVKNDFYEYITKYDDEKMTREYRKIRTYNENVIFDFTDFDQYDSKGRLIYSRYYSHITTTDTKLLSAEIKESFYDYDENDRIIHKKEKFRDEERNTYFEYFYWDNGDLNTAIVYEEVL